MEVTKTTATIKNIQPLKITITKEIDLKISPNYTPRRNLPKPSKYDIDYDIVIIEGKYHIASDPTPIPLEEYFDNTELKTITKEIDDHLITQLQ